MSIFFHTLGIIGAFFMGIGWLLLFSIALTASNSREALDGALGMRGWPRWIIPFLFLTKLYIFIMTYGISWFVEIFSNSESLDDGRKRAIGVGFALFAIGLSASFLARFVERSL